MARDLRQVIAKPEAVDEDLEMAAHPLFGNGFSYTAFFWRRQA